MEPTIVIGLGTSGLKILEYCQQFLYEAYGATMMEQVEAAGIRLINIETDRGVPVRETPVGTVITKVNATVQSMGTSYEALKRKPQVDVSWMPPNLDAALESMGITAGAGGWRAYGRFALWNPDNFDKIYKLLAGAYNDIANIGSPNIFTVGTLMGGTCSGMFIDMGYILRDISNNSALSNIGLFLVPKATGLGNEAHRQCGNTWASLKDLNYYNEQQNVYDYHWPNGVQPSSANFPPYTECYLLSSQYERNASNFPSLKLDHLYYLCGFYLFLNIAGMRKEIAARRVDDLGGNPLYTFGLSGFSYPKYGITELVGAQLAEEYCMRMLDPQYYWARDVGERVAIDETLIERDAEKFINGLVGECLEQYDSWSEGNLQSFVKEQVLLWQKGDIETEGIRNQFKHHPGDTSSARARMNAKVNTVRDFVIESIFNEIRGVLETYQSIPYTKKLLKALSNHSDRLLDLWAKQGVSSGEMKALNATIDGISVEKQGWLSLDREGRNEAVALAFADRVKLSFMYSVLNEIDFEKGEPRYKGETLLGLSELDAMERGLTSDAGVIKTVKEHQLSIESMLSDAHLPLRMLWKNGSLDKERAFFMEIMQNRPADTLRLLDDKGGLLGFLREIQIEKGEMKGKYAWADLVSAFQGLVESSVTSELGSIDLVDLVKSQDVAVARQANKAESVLLPLEVGGNRFGTSDGIPSITAGNSTGTMNELLDNIEGFDRLCTLEELRNTVVFYREQSHIAPMTDLINREKLQEQREKRARPEASESEVFTQDSWDKMLDPYQVEDRLLQPGVDSFVNVITLGLMTWFIEPRSGALQPRGVNSKGLSWNTTPTGGELSVAGGNPSCCKGRRTKRSGMICRKNS